MQGNKKYSIITDYLGTPVQAYDEYGSLSWERELDIYGEVRKGNSDFIPFLYQGQYYDAEVELAYNRFRYYSPESGGYISQDPIGLAGNNPNVYAYVYDVNSWIDIFGLNTAPSLPAKVVLESGNIKIVHYYDPALMADHAPLHFHIEENGKNIGKIKADGTILKEKKGSKKGFKKALNLLNSGNNKNKVRKVERKLANYIRANGSEVMGQPFNPGGRGPKGAGCA